MTEAAQTIMVDYHEDGRQHEPFQHLRITNLPFGDILDRLRDAVRAEDLWVLHEIDPQAILGRIHYAMGEARQILFFHPRLMARLLEADPSALLEVPLKIAVIVGDAGRVSVRWQDPADSFARYGNAALAALGVELAPLYERIVAAALAD
jgi:uncharacterized protein (DUF302 family)